MRWLCFSLIFAAWVATGKAFRPPMPCNPLVHTALPNLGLEAAKITSADSDADLESAADSIPTSPSYHEDPSGLFRTTPDGSYVPAGLTAEEYAELRRNEADRHADKNYAAWGPRFHPADGPVADDMAWMVNPGLWTGEVPEQNSSGEETSEDEVEDLPLPLHMGPAFLKHAMPWAHAEAAASKEGSWQSTYERFCQGVPVQEMIAEVIQTNGDDNEGDDVERTCRLVNQILQGVTHYGGVAIGDGMNMEDAVKHVDLARIAHHCAPSSLDWYVMQQAEQDVVEVDSVSALDISARLNFLKAILRVRTGDDDTAMNLDQFSSGDLAEMYLCMDWYMALRRIGISDPFENSKE